MVLVPPAYELLGEVGDGSGCGFVQVKHVAAEVVDVLLR